MSDFWCGMAGVVAVTLIGCFLRDVVGFKYYLGASIGLAFSVAGWIARR